MIRDCSKRAGGSKVISLQDKCIKIHAKMLVLQKMLKKIEKRETRNYAWRGLLNSAIAGMNEALCDLENRLDHIKSELEEVLEEKKGL